MKPRNFSITFYFYFSGILSYSTKAINDILKFSFDSVIIVVEDSSSAESNTEQTDGLLYAELASRSNAEVSDKMQNLFP